MTANDLELLFTNNEKKNIRGESYFEFKEPKASSSMENKNENVSSTEESDAVKASANFPIVDVKDYDIAEKTTSSKKRKKRTLKPEKIWRKPNSTSWLTWKP